MAMQYSVYYINTNEVPNQLNYAAKGATYYIAIATAISLSVKLTCRFTCEDILFCFCTKAHLVFSLVFI